MLKINKLGIINAITDEYILTPLSFVIAKSEIVAVIGESGAGKSLLAQALLGDSPVGFNLVGSIKQSENRISCQHTVALAAQSANVFDPLRNIFSHFKQRLYSSSNHYQLDADELARLQIDNKIGLLYCHQLSGGMAKKALLAQAAIQKTDYLIADEPCNGLDEQAVIQMYDNLRRLAKQQQGILLISHNLRQVMAYADRIIVLKDGYLVEETTPEAIRINNCQPYTQGLLQALPENWRLKHARII